MTATQSKLKVADLQNQYRYYQILVHLAHNTRLSDINIENHRANQYKQPTQRDLISITFKYACK